LNHRFVSKQQHQQQEQQQQQIFIRQTKISSIPHVIFSDIFPGVRGNLIKGIIIVCSTNFIIIIRILFHQQVDERAAFMCADPKSVKRQSSHQCLFAILGSAQVKAAHKTLVKLNPGVNIWNFIRDDFYKIKHFIRDSFD